MRPRSSRRQRRWRENRPVAHYGKWRVRWRDHTGQRRSEIYDREEDALLAVQRHQLEVEEIKRGLRPPLRASDKTFSDLFDYWLKKRAPRKRSGSDDKSIIDAYLKDFFGPILLRDFAVAHVETFVEGVRVRRPTRTGERPKLSDKTIANLLTLLISTLNAAKDDLGWITTVPKIRKPAKFSVSDDYRYLRTKQEIIRFLAAARDEDEERTKPKAKRKTRTKRKTKTKRIRTKMLFACYATAIYTGMRAGEIAGLRWADVDFDRRLITVQRSFDGPTKSGRIRRVPILNALLPILRAWRLRNPLALVFPNERGDMHGESARLFQELFKRVLDRAGFPRHKVGNKERHYIRFHDLRHTFASHWVMDGGDLFRLQKILGHQSVQMTMRYAHLSPDIFAEDYDRLIGTAPGAAENVVEMPAATEKRS